MDLENIIDEEPSKTEFRSKLSDMSFEELQKLKSKLGAKVYNEAVFGTNTKKRTKKVADFKRENKNRPREMSSKKTVPMLKDVTAKTEEAVRDPRFDTSCGTYNAKAFKRSYSFVNKIRSRELIELKGQLKETTDKESQDKLKYLIQRMENQKREEVKNKIKMKKEDKEKRERYEMAKEGKKPIYVKKSDKKVMDLVEQYETLKSSGKLEKHITKHRKRNAQKSKKKSSFM